MYLQNVKLKALTRLGEVQPAIETKRREIEGLRNLRDAYEKNRTLGDAGSVMEVSWAERQGNRLLLTTWKSSEPICIHA